MSETKQEQEQRGLKILEEGINNPEGYDAITSIRAALGLIESKPARDKAAELIWLKIHGTRRTK